MKWAIQKSYTNTPLCIVTETGSDTAPQRVPTPSESIGVECENVFCFKSDFSHCKHICGTFSCNMHCVVCALAMFLHLYNQLLDVFTHL